MKERLKKENHHILGHGHKISRILDVNLPARSSVFFTVINLFSKGAAFLFTPIFTRILSAEDFGEYSLFSSLLSVTVVIGSLEMSGGVILRAHQRDKEATALTTLSAAIITSLIIIPLTAVLYYMRDGGGASFPYAYLLLLILALSTNIINLYLSGQRYLYKWGPSLAVAVLQSIAAPIIGIFLIETERLSRMDHVFVKISAVCAVNLAIALIFLIMIIINTVRYVKNKKLNARAIISSVWDKVKLLLRLSLPLLPYYVSIMAIAQSDKIIISRALGAESLAKYSVAYSAGISLNAIMSGIGGALSPWIMRKVRAMEYKKIKSTVGLVINLYIGIITAFLSLSPEIFAFLAPKNYQSALPVLFIIAICPIPLAIAQAMSTVAIAKERVGGVLISGIVPAILAISANSLLIGKFGIISAAFVTLFAYVILVFAETYNTKRLLGEYLIYPKGQLLKFLGLILSSGVIYVIRSSIALRLLVLALSSLFILYILRRAKPIILERKQENSAI